MITKMKTHYATFFNASKSFTVWLNPFSRISPIRIWPHKPAKKAYNFENNRLFILRERSKFIRKYWLRQQSEERGREATSAAAAPEGKNRRKGREGTGEWLI